MSVELSFSLLVVSSCPDRAGRELKPILPQDSSLQLPPVCLEAQAERGDLPQIHPDHRPPVSPWVSPNL